MSVLSSASSSPDLGLRGMSKPREPEEVLRDHIRAIPYGKNGVIAAAAEIAEETLSRWKNPKERPPNPDLATLKRLAEALNLPLVALLSDELGAPLRLVDAARAKVADADRLLSEAQGVAAEVNRRSKELAARRRKGKRRPSKGGGPG